MEEEEEEDREEKAWTWGHEKEQSETISLISPLSLWAAFGYSVARVTRCANSVRLQQPERWFVQQLFADAALFSDSLPARTDSIPLL